MADGNIAVRVGRGRIGVACIGLGSVVKMSMTCIKAVPFSFFRYPNPPKIRPVEERPASSAIFAIPNNMIEDIAL